MKRFSLELPKFRLELHAKLVKRRKPLISEPIIPSVKHVRRKYRSGTLLGKIGRHLAAHKNIRKVFAANFAVLATFASFIPGGTSAVVPAESDEVVIQTQNTLITQKAVQYPTETVKINQGYSFFHPATDLGGPIGTPVKQIKEGKVVFAGRRTDGYGNLIVLDHGKGLESFYAHLSKIEVEENQVVNTNMEIGQIGTTGYATGPHLHLEIHQNSLPLNPISILSR